MRTVRDDWHEKLNSYQRKIVETCKWNACDFPDLGILKRGTKS
jgi:hypothetical protein